jgi:hypothetical protein
MICKDKLLEDTRKKAIDILTRYHEWKTYIKIKESEIKNLKEIVLSSEELIDLYDCSEGDLYRMYCYNNDSIVEIEVFKSLRREKKRAVKIRLIKKDIENYQSNVNIIKAILLMIDDIMKDMNSDYRLLIKLCYTERKITRDRFEDIVNRFNEGRRIKLTDKRVTQLKNEAVLIIAKRLKDMKIMSYYTIGE